MFLLLGLVGAYSISRMTRVLDQNTSFFRKIVSGAIVATSPLILFVAADALMLATATIVETRGNTTLQLTNIDPITLYLGTILSFVLLISVACWILTAKLYYIGVFLNLLTLPVTFALLYIAARILTVPSDWSELITYPIYFSLLTASCGFWIAAGTRAS